MADGYWARQPPAYPSAAVAKRPRAEFDLPPGAPSSQENLHYLPRDDAHPGHHALKDTASIGASYDRYLQNSQPSPFGPGEHGSIDGSEYARGIGSASGSGYARGIGSAEPSNFDGSGYARGIGSAEHSNFSGSGYARGIGSGMPEPAGGMHSLPYGASGMMGGRGPRTVGPEMVANGRGMGFGSQLPLDPVVRPGLLGREMPMLPPDASNTVFAEGLPRDCTQREVAYIFRPFLGYKETRLVTKEPKYREGDRVVICFVDFADAFCAMTAMNALQGYKMDENDPDSSVLRLQFSRYPGPKSSHGSRGRR